jgi:hypothetical protein
MKKMYLFCFLMSSLAWCQPQMELTPQGFEPVEVSIPATTSLKLIDVSKAWAQDYNRRENNTYDITNVTDNSVTISAFKRNAFFYRDRGDTFEQKIRYTIKLTFYNNRYELAFTVNDIYTDGNVLVKYKIPDYFTSEGKLKDGYDGLTGSLEKTVNEIVTSHYNFILNYR